MARKSRYFVPNGYYHVYARVTRGEMIYDDPVLSEQRGTFPLIAFRRALGATQLLPTGDAFYEESLHHHQ